MPHWLLAKNALLFDLRVDEKKNGKLSVYNNQVKLKLQILSLIPHSKLTLPWIRRRQIENSKM